MTGMAVLLLVRPIVHHRDRFAQSDERGDGWSADGEHLDRAPEHRGSNAGFLLGHHLGSGRPRRSDSSAAAVRHDDVAGDVAFGFQFPFEKEPLLQVGNDHARQMYYPYYL